MKCDAQISKFFVDVSWVDPYQICYNQSAYPILNGIISNFVHFVANSEIFWFKKSYLCDDHSGT